MDNIRIGAGYNQFFIAEDKLEKLPIHSAVTHVELGMSEYVRWCANPPKQLKLSLHLARTPICENNNSQDIFVNYLTDFLHSEERHSDVLPTSIGVHLIGPRNQGIGRYGFSTHYTNSVKHNAQACCFVDQMQNRLNLPIWIENANFYSSSAREIISTWLGIKSICESTDARLILDLSHLFIDCSNNNMSPYNILSLLPWSQICEIHLSGVIQGGDGNFHDGHSNPISAPIWSLLEECLSVFISKDSNLIVTIEHTDPEWNSTRDTYHSDFEKLLAMLDKSSLTVDTHIDADRYAYAYLKKLLKQWIPLLPRACLQRNLSFDGIYGSWIKDLHNNCDHRIALSRDEVPPEELVNVVIAAEDFLKFAKARIFTKQ